MPTLAALHQTQSSAQKNTPETGCISLKSQHSTNAALSQKLTESPNRGFEFALGRQKHDAEVIGGS